jgi:hypothetical protein
MAFVKNTYQQMSFYDTLNQLSEREMRLLDKSWAKVFGDEIFPKIDESRFAVLYSGREASRPNTPVNIIVGGLLLERMFDLNDEEIIETINFDVRYQYALHTTVYDQQPFSTNTFRRFRNRNDAYREASGVDLLEECLGELTGLILENPRLKAAARRLVKGS